MLSLPRASMRDYLHFIQVKIDDRNVRVCNMDEFFAAPESFLTGEKGEKQTIFLHKQPGPLSDPHYTQQLYFILKNILKSSTP